MPNARYRANLGFSGAGQDVRRGEVVVVDEASWAPWIEAGYLTPLDQAEAKLGVPSDAAGLPHSLTIEQGEPEPGAE